MREKFFIVSVICFSLFLTSGFFWVPADAKTTGTMMVSGNMPLVCYNLSTAGIGSDNATIIWKTNGNANSTVTYGTTTDYSTTSADNLMNSSHSIRLSNLSTGTRYHYQMISVTDDGKSCTSPDSTLKTLSPAGTIIATAEQNTTFSGVTVKTVNGVQQVSLNLSELSGTIQISGNTVTVSNPGNGWSALQYTGTDVINDNGIISIDGMEDVTMQSDPVTADLGGNLGTVSTVIDIALTRLVSGVSIQQEVIEGAGTSVARAFQLAAAGNNLDITSVAYTVEFRNTGPLNANLGNAGVTLDLSIDHAWVIENAPDGDVNNIRILRLGEDGTKEVLTTHYTGSLGSTDYFKAQSPHGLSVFGLTAVTSAVDQPIIITPVRSGYMFSGPVNDIGDSEVNSLKVTTVPTTRKTAVPVASPALVNQQQTVRAPREPTPRTAPPLHAPKDVPGYLLFFVEENILKMAMVAGATCIGIALVIWYNQRTRWE
jgi:hypothetical protein